MENVMEKMRSYTRTGGFIILLLTLCAAIFVPSIATDIKNLIIGALINALGVIIVFYFKKEE